MTSKVATPRASLREAINSAAGPVAVTNRVFVLFAMPAIILLVVGNVQYFLSAPLRWILISAIGYLVTIAVMMAFRATVLPADSNRGPKILLTSVAFVVAGIARGLSIHSFGILLGVVPSDELLFRLISGPLFVYGAFGTLAIIESSRLRHEKALTVLDAEKRELDELRGGIRERIRVQKAELLQQVQTVLNPAIDQVRNELQKTSSTNLADKLKNVVENVVRPLSHNIGTSNTVIDTQIRAIKSGSALNSRSKIILGRISVGSMIVPELAMFATASVAIAANILYNPDLAFLASLVTLATIYGSNWLARFLFKRVWVPVLVAILIVNAQAIISALAVDRALLLVGIEVPDSPIIQLAISEVFICNLILTMQLVRTRRKALEAEMTNVIADLGILNSQLRQEVWLNRRKIAAILHGSVQGALYAGAIRLAKSEAPTAEEVAQVQEDIANALNKLEFADGSEHLFDVLNQIKDVWQGAVDITLPELKNETIKALEGNLVAEACVAEVIRESVSNAVKHGNAKHIRVDLNMVTDNLALVRVQNDGEPVSAEAKAGYGSSILDEVAYKWSLESQDSGAVLTATVAV